MVSAVFTDEFKQYLALRNAARRYFAPSRSWVNRGSSIERAMAESVALHGSFGAVELFAGEDGSLAARLRLGHALAEPVVIVVRALTVGVDAEVFFGSPELAPGDAFVSIANPAWEASEAIDADGILRGDVLVWASPARFHARLLEMRGIRP